VGDSLSERFIFGLGRLVVGEERANALGAIVTAAPFDDPVQVGEVSQGIDLGVEEEVDDRSGAGRAV
jgi:hypothetical protein